MKKAESSHSVDVRLKIEFILGILRGLWGKEIYT